MNANVNEVTTLDKGLIIAEVAAIVQAIKDARVDRSKASGENETAISLVRKLAIQANEAGKPIGPIADYMHETMIGAKLPKGSADPYRVAMKGYAVALKEGVPVELGHGPKGDKPMTAPAAREFAQYTREEREERAAIAAVKREITAAVGRATDVAMLNRILAEIVDIVPAAAAEEPGTVTVTAPAESLLDGLFPEEAQAA